MMLKSLLEKIAKAVDHDLDHFADHDADENNVTLVVTHIDYEAHRHAMCELKELARTVLKENLPEKCERCNGTGRMLIAIADTRIKCDQCQA